MRTLDTQDTISGKEGRAYAKIDGNNEEMFFAKSIEATVKKSKGQVKAIGMRMVGHKTTGAEGTGSMTLYYLSPLFRAKLSEVNLDATVLAKLDGDSDDPLEEDVNFTFEDFEILESFQKL